MFLIVLHAHFNCVGLYCQTKQRQRLVEYMLKENINKDNSGILYDLILFTKCGAI